MYIYCDILENVVVGDSYAPLLFSCALNYSSRKPITISPIRSYVNLDKTYFETIFIYICNEFGEELVFNNGSTNITVHFRPTKI